MTLSEIGKIVEREWFTTPQIRPDMHIEMDAFVVMPNHIHGIIVIGINEYNHGNDFGNTQRRDAMHRVSTNTNTNPYPTNHMIANSSNQTIRHPTERDKFAPQSHNLASILRGYKSVVTIGARKINPGFAWQPRYHDRIIRNEPELNRIREYIINNPRNWPDDKNNRQMM